MDFIIKLRTFIAMKELKVTIYNHAKELPPILESNFFHSPELMELCERTPRMKPYMAVVTDGDGTVMAHMLAIVYYRRSWLPPFLYSHVRVVGEGVYHCTNDHHTEQLLFGRMAEALTERMQNRALYVEFSHLSQKMYGYKELKQLGFFHVKWMNIHNSLHSRTPEERIHERQMKRIEAAQERGAETKLVETEAEFQQFSKLLRRHNWLKPRKYLPVDNFFRGMMKSNNCRLFITTYHERVIGCCACVHSDGDTYLWYTASRRKSYAPLHPNAVTIWNAIKHAHQEGMQHFRFIDVGLPFRKNPYRDFILSFGGKEVTGFRWFRISIRWANALASWWWRE